MRIEERAGRKIIGTEDVIGREKKISAKTSRKKVTGIGVSKSDFVFRAEGGIRSSVASRGLGDVYKGQ
ncbi:hypothetical protein, partial [Clostridium botulinum]|uniref:hypothetical protein n=1 Tax=Clostridium botulinum TaxID=1491 RepID=UPI001E34A35E